MPFNITAEQSDLVSQSLGRIDKAAETIQENHKAWGMPFEQAKEIVNALDKSADEIEGFIFGEESVQRRQAEVIASEMAKEGKVHQRDNDEGYMDTYNTPQAPIQTDADEPYMNAYKDDQSSGVTGEKDDGGRQLTPGHT